MWFFMASLIPQIQTSTCSSPSHLVPRRQDSRLLISDALFIMAKSLLILLQLPSCLINYFMSSIDLFLKTFFLWSSYFHRYPILRSSTWSILSWLWASHKCWTKLIFFLLLLMCFFAWLDIDSSIWNYPLVDIIYWSYSSIFSIIVLQEIYQWIHLYFPFRICLYI
jgi:hypothetical protein